MWWSIILVIAGILMIIFAPKQPNACNVLGVMAVIAGILWLFN